MNETGSKLNEAGKVFVAADKFPILKDSAPDGSDGKLNNEQMGQIDAAIVAAQAAKAESQPIDLYKALKQAKIDKDTLFQHQTLSGRQRYGGQKFDGKDFFFSGLRSADQGRLNGPGEIPQLFDSKDLISPQDKITLMFPLFKEYKQTKDAAEQAREVAFQLMMQKLFDLIKASENPKETIALLKEKLQEAKNEAGNDQGLSGVTKNSWSNLLEILKGNKPKNTPPNASLELETDELEKNIQTAKLELKNKLTEMGPDLIGSVIDNIVEQVMFYHLGGRGEGGLIDARIKPLVDITIVGPKNEALMFKAIKEWAERWQKLKNKKLTTTATTSVEQPKPLTSNLGSEPVYFGSGPARINESNGKDNFK